MERLSGFKFSDVEGMRAAGIDTDAVVRSGMIGFLEGAMMYGIFHGDLHGGNLFILPSGKIALLDFGITARLSESKRLALLSSSSGPPTAIYRPRWPPCATWRAARGERCRRGDRPNWDSTGRRSTRRR